MNTVPTTIDRDYRAKLKRAQHHVNDLRSTFLADHHAGRFRPDVVPNIDGPGKGYDLTFRVPQDRMIMYSLIAGDAIQNLRATLDHLAFALAGKKAGGHTQFPIFSRLTDFAEKSVPMLAGMSDESRAAIERLQPYHAGQHFETDALWKLNRMSNIDKHRLLHVVALSLSGERIRDVHEQQPVDPSIHVGYESTGPLVDGSVKRAIPPSKPGMNVQYDTAMHITFKDIQPSVGTDALQLLAELLRSVEDVVALLEPEVPA